MRLPYLDSIRGIAALIVLTSHLHQVARGQTWFFDVDGLRFLNASGFSVSIFFVLSGLVLFLQFERGKISYLSYAVRRAFRIVPACLVAVIVSALIYYFWAPPAVPGLGAWFNDVSWRPGIALTVSQDTAVSLLRPTWSLVHEWRISLVFPIIALLTIYYPRALSVAAGVVAILLSGPLEWMMNSEFYSYANTVFYSTFFVAGAFVGANRVAIIKFLEQRTVLRLTMLATCLYWVCCKDVPDGFVSWLSHGIVGTGIIMFCMSDPTARRLLSKKLPTYLGRISYSLYLVHIIWIGILFRVLDGASPLIISGLVIFASLISADAVHRLVETPMNRIGRSLAGSIESHIMVLKVRFSR